MAIAGVKHGVKIIGPIGIYRSNVTMTDPLAGAEDAGDGVYPGRFNPPTNHGVGAKPGGVMIKDNPDSAQDLLLQ